MISPWGWGDLGLRCSPETSYVTICHSEKKLIFHSFLIIFFRGFNFVYVLSLSESLGGPGEL